jgi:hypothetical protein
MKIFAGIVIAAGMMVTQASAVTLVYATADCTLNSPLSGIIFHNPLPNGTVTGSFTCPSASTIPSLAGQNIISEFLVYEGDYSSGRAAQVTEVTNFTFSGFTGATLSFNSDTVTTTGTSSSNSVVCPAGGTFHQLDFTDFLPATVQAGCYNNVSGTLGTSGTVNFTNQFTAGSAADGTGYVQIVYDYNVTTSSSTPEPVSMVLFGVGLLGVSIVGRKKFARK